MLNLKPNYRANLGTFVHTMCHPTPLRRAAKNARMTSSWRVAACALAKLSYANNGSKNKLYNIRQQAYQQITPLSPVAGGDNFGEADLAAQLVVLQSAEGLGENVTQLLRRSDELDFD